jgi:hypothetical protein
MKRGTIEKFGVRAIADAVKGSDVPTARRSLSVVVGAAVDVSGTVQKVVKRDGLCKLVIQPENAPEFVVFADCQPDAENLTKLNIRKGSSVRVKGKFQSFGAAAVCLSDCRLFAEVRAKKKKSDVRVTWKNGQIGHLKKENGKPHKTSQ